MDIPMEKDKSGNAYAEVGNIRITYQPQSKRSEDKNWAGSDVIRIQAYKGDREISHSLFPGAEFPIENEAAFIELIQTLCAVYRTGKAQS